MTAADGTIARVNRTFEELTGHRREDLVGARRFQDLLNAGGRIYHETHYAPLLRMQGAVREIALDVVRADGSRMSALVNSVLEGETVRTAVFPAADRRSYERALIDARDRERSARKHAERLQHLTAALAAAADAEAVATAVAEALVGGLGAEAAAIVVDGDRTDTRRVLGQPEAVGPAQAGAGVRAPLAAAGRTPGFLWLSFAAPRALTEEERGLLHACAAQAAVALDRALLYEEQRAVAYALQRSLLAGEPPADPRFRVATLYRPGVDGLEVGGDWYDTFLLRDGRVAVVVGDVVGRGLAAASAMGQLRSAVRALAGAELGPAGVLAELDTFVAQVPSARFATVAYAEIAPDSGVTRLALAGHMPPVVLHPDEPPELVAARAGAPPLGVAAAGAAERPETELVLPPGGGLLLYTDGLVERRTEPIDVGLGRLLDALRERPGLAPRDLVAALPATVLADGRTDDDVCCLCFVRARERAVLAGAGQGRSSTSAT